MPTAKNGDVDLYYEVAGSGHTVCFVSDLGCGPWLWSWQAPSLAGQYETIVWDLRGTGQSDGAEEYGIERQAADLESVLAEHSVQHATLVGAGMGGMIALAYANTYSRVDRLALLGTTAKGVCFTPDPFLGGSHDVDALTSQAFRDAHPEAINQIVEWREDEDATPSVKRLQAEAVAAFDISDSLYEITGPALVCHGTADMVVPQEAGESLARDLPRGNIERFGDGSHFFFIEQSRLVSDALAGFLESDIE